MECHSTACKVSSQSDSLLLYFRLTSDIQGLYYEDFKNKKPELSDLTVQLKAYIA